MRKKGYLQSSTLGYMLTTLSHHVFRVPTSHHLHVTGHRLYDAVQSVHFPVWSMQSRYGGEMLVSKRREAPSRDAEANPSKMSPLPDDKPKIVQLSNFAYARLFWWFWEDRNMSFTGCSSPPIEGYDLQPTPR